MSEEGQVIAWVRGKAMASHCRYARGMTCIAPIAEDSVTLKLSRGQIDFDKWRGRAIDQFAITERAVSNALVELGGPPDKAHALHLVGRKFDRLEMLVAKDGAFGTAGGQVRAALPRYRKHDDLRRTLCHGEVSLAIDVAGWVAILRYTCFHSSTVSRVEKVITQADAIAMLAAIESDGATLRGQLRHLLKQALATK